MHAPPLPTRRPPPDLFSLLQRWVDGKYTWRMAGWVGYNQLGSQYTNLQCGSSILHLVCDAWDSKPPPSG